MHVLTEKQVQDAQQYGRQYAQAQTLPADVSPPTTSSLATTALTIGSKKSSWNGRMQDHSTVLAIDLSSFSIGAIHSALPVSARRRLALRRSSTGWYVSGTNKAIRVSCGRASACVHMRAWAWASRAVCHADCA
jgi:hypothetical protein